MSPVACLIPAYQPEAALPELVKILTKTSAVFVINDGSPSRYDSLFEEAARAGAKVLRHAQNQGKGAALKSGFAAIHKGVGKAVGVLTLDADGQHRIEDVLKVLEYSTQHPESLILGSRMTQANHVPWRSRFGNNLASLLFEARTRTKILDTQTGLRFYPASCFSWLLEIPYDRYEFEMIALYEFVRRGIAVQEIPIQTIYIDGNRSSHFKPLRDTFRIWRALNSFINSYNSSKK